MSTKVQPGLESTTDNPSLDGETWIPDGAWRTPPGWCYGCGQMVDEPGYHRPGDIGFCYRVDFGGAFPADPADLIASAVRHVLLNVLDLDNADDRTLSAGMAERAQARVIRSLNAWAHR